MNTEEMDPSTVPTLKKQSSSNNSYRIKTVEEMQGMLPARIKQANELLCLDSDDDVMTVMRYFTWNL